MKEFLVNFWKKNKDKIIESAKTAVRQVLFLTVSLLVSAGLEHVSALPQTQTTMVSLMILNYIDKYIHENWSESKDKSGMRGLSPI